MKNFLRKNLMIVVSIALPLLVVVFFTLTRMLPGLYTQPPAYDFLLVQRDWSGESEIPVRIVLSVKDGRFSATVSSTRENRRGNLPRIFRYNHVSGETREIAIPLPGDLASLPEGSQIAVPELAGLEVKNVFRAPDGYEYRGHRRNTGLMMDLFGGTRDRHDVTIGKNGAFVRVRLPRSDYWYGDVQFLGWIINQG